MTHTAHLGDTQNPSLGLFDASIPRLAHYSGLLGNLRAQTPGSKVVDFPEEELWLWASLNKQFAAARPESKLTILKRRNFTPEGREERIRLALAALEAPQPTNLTIEQLKSVIEEVESEDEEE